MDKRIITALSAISTMIFLSCAGSGNLDEGALSDDLLRMSERSSETGAEDAAYPIKSLVDSVAANRASRFRWNEVDSILGSREKISRGEALLLATARNETGNFDGAAKIAAQIAFDNSFPLQDYAKLAYSEALANIDSIGRAATVLKGIREEPFEEEAMAHRFAIYRDSENPREALEALDTLISHYPDHFGKSSLSMSRGRLNVELGDTERGVEFYKSVLAKGSNSYGYRAASGLEKLKRLKGRDLFLAGRAAVKSKNYQSGEKWLKSYIESGGKANVGEAKYLRARAVSRRGRYTEAIGFYKKIVSEKAYNEAWANLGIAYCYRKIGRFDDAKRFLDRAIADGKGTNAEAEALWEGVELGEDMGDFDMAADYALRLSKRFPGHDLGDNGAMWSGLAKFYKRDYSEAAGRFAFIPEKFNDRKFIETGKYWQGISLISAGDDAGLPLLDEVSTSPLRNYYRYLATEELTGTPLPKPISSRSKGWMTFEDAIEMASEALSESGYRHVLLSTDSRFAVRAEMLANMGLISSSEREFRRWMETLTIDPPTRIALLSIATEWRLFGIAYDIALALVRDMGGYASAPIAVIRLAYPMFYAEEIFNAAERESIDAALLFAIVRRESTFDPHIVSYAGAIGLFQIMPQTGKSIAQQFDPEEDFHKIHLYDWQISIDYGARYLADLLREHELAEYAIAEYNAGPKPVKRWKKNLRDNRRETFVEGIDYLQTRHYVKNVLGDYYAYKEMWDGSL